MKHADDDDDDLVAATLRWIGPGRASKYIKPFQCRPGDRFVLCLRVSGRERKRNLNDSECNLRQVLTEHGGIVVGVVSHIGSGFDAYWVRQAAVIARHHHAKLLAETTDRLIRNSSFHSSQRPNLQAAEDELEELVRCTLGVPLMTHLHPDASPNEVRAYQAKRGQKWKGHKGGRPRKRLPGYKKHRRQKMQPIVLWWWKIGVPVSNIVKLTGIKRRTCYFWINQSCA